MNEDYLLSKEVLQMYFKDLSNVLVDMKDDQMELTDRFIVEPIEVWVPSDHDFILIKNQIESLKDHSKNSINTILRRSLLNQDILYQLTYHEIEQRIKKEFNDLLFQMNYLQERYGDFYFISKLVPSIDQIKRNTSKFPELLDNLLNDKLLPKIADQYLEEDIEGTANYSIKISDPVFSLSEDPLHKTSFLYLMIDVLDRRMEVMNEFNISLEFEYLDYSKFLWIYEDSEQDFSNDHLSYTNEINKAIQRFVKRRQILRYDDISLLLVDYNGLSSKDSFVADRIDQNDATVKIFSELADRGELSDFVISYEPMNKEGSIVKAIIHSDNTDDFALFIGPGGISSSYGPIYSSEHKIQGHSSLRDASRRLQTMIGYQTDQVPTMMAIFDKRRQKQLELKGM